MKLFEPQTTCRGLCSGLSSVCSVLLRLHKDPKTSINNPVCSLTGKTQGREVLLMDVLDERISIFQPLCGQ